MKIKFLLLSFLITTNLFAQEKFLIDTMSIDKNTKLIGRYPQYDKSKTYSKWNFIIENPEEIKKIVKSLTYRDEVPNAFEDPNFMITIVQNYDEVKTWTINPKTQTVSFAGHTYKFDLGKITHLNKKYPFDYKFENKDFKAKGEYISYLEEQKKNKSFLFDYGPSFKYEGSFEIEFPKNQEFSSPKKISEYLKPLIEEIVNENEYRVTYTLNEKNMTDQNQFTMTITGSKKLFKNLNLKKVKKGKWEDMTETGMFFYRTK